VSAVETHRLGKRYGRTWALRDCSLRIGEGEVVALVGPNGAGKSTLLGLLTGLLEPTEGELRVCDVRPAGEVRARVAFTAQGHPLYRSFTPADMLRAGRGLNAVWDEAAARERLVALEIPLDRRIGRLSGGQQAQVSLALALAKRPRLLLLDEPLAALDPLARREFMRVLMEVAAERTVTIVLSSHVVSDLERCCDHLVTLHRGRVQVAGAIDDLLENHAVLVGPADAEAALRRAHTVVSATTAGRQLTAMVRRGKGTVDPVWRVEPVRLEELVLTYLGHPDEGAFSGPVGVRA
jgi:ABC-2 type transport system ATP-binding protein